MAELAVVCRELAAQPILLIRRSVARAALAEMLGECFGKLFSLGHGRGLPVSGWPIARYVSMGPGRWVVEAAMPLSAPVSTAQLDDPSIEAASLPAGPAAFAVHIGPYQTLPDTHALIEQWIQGQGLEAGGPRWESYVTDPGQNPDPAQWRTEIYLPLKSAAASRP